MFAWFTKLADVQTAAKTLGIDIELEKVTDINAIVAAGIMMTPALAVDGKIVSSGRVIRPEEIAKYLQPSGCSCGGKCECQQDVGTDTKESPCRCSGKKSWRKTVAALLLLFVFSSVAVMAVREMRGKTVPKNQMQEVTGTPIQRDVLTVYYFLQEGAVKMLGSGK